MLFCCHGNTQYPAPSDIYPIYSYPFMNHHPIHKPFTPIFNWKDNLNVKYFIQELVFINYHQIYKLVSMATEFFRVHGISERKKLFFKEREMKNIKILIT